MIFFLGKKGLSWLMYSFTRSRIPQHCFLVCCWTLKVVALYTPNWERNLKCVAVRLTDWPDFQSYQGPVRVVGEELCLLLHVYPCAIDGNHSSSVPLGTWNYLKLYKTVHTARAWALTLMISRETSTSQRTYTLTMGTSLFLQQLSAVVLIVVVSPFSILLCMFATDVLGHSGISQYARGIWNWRS